MKPNTVEQISQNIQSKFKSLNSVPVTSVRLTKDEWDVLYRNLNKTLTNKDAERYSWIQRNIHEERVEDYRIGLETIVYKMVYVFPKLTAFTEDGGEISLNDAIDHAISIKG